METSCAPYGVDQSGLLQNEAGSAPAALTSRRTTMQSLTQLLGRPDASAPAAMEFMRNRHWLCG